MSLPYGHYSGITDDASFTTTSFVDRLIPIADYTVTTNLQTLTFDARTATVRPSVHTPSSADLDTFSLEFDRDTAHGSLGRDSLPSGRASRSMSLPRPRHATGSCTG